MALSRYIEVSPHIVEGEGMTLHRAIGAANQGNPASVQLTPREFQEQTVVSDGGSGVTVANTILVNSQVSVYNETQGVAVLVASFLAQAITIDANQVEEDDVLTVRYQSAGTTYALSVGGGGAGVFVPTPIPPNTTITFGGTVSALIVS